MASESIDSQRERLTFRRVADREALLAKDLLVIDPRRQRPHWFDGRFLAASDLRHEQNYFLLRQGDLGRAGGEGVVEGLLVSEQRRPNSGAEVLAIEPGFGFTDTGELVCVPNELKVVPHDIPRTQQLDAAFGLEVLPNDPGRSRTGLFVLALRPVEWTANPIAAYPTTLNGQRHAEDANVIEAAAVTLIPWPDEGVSLPWPRRRANAVREIFVRQRARGLTTGTLPLALVALRGNFIEWVDPFLVRRELGADRREGLDFGFGNRPLREAHLLQYEQQLGELLRAAPQANFSATTHFDALPPVGRIPPAAIDPANLTQRFFPRGIDVSVSFVPEDEVPALLEESLLLPPLDLLAGEKALKGTSVLILAPLARAEFDRRRRALVGKSWELAYVALESKVEATPFEMLFARRPLEERMEARIVTAAGAADAAGEAEWRVLLTQAVAAGTLWFVRQRHWPVQLHMPGTPVDADAAEAAAPEELVTALASDAALGEAIRALRELDRPEVDALLPRLAAPRLLRNNRVLLRGLLQAFVDRSFTLFEAVRGLTAALDPDLGSGFARVGEEEGRALAEKFVNSGGLVEVDELLRAVSDERVEKAQELIDPLAALSRDALLSELARVRAELLAP